MATGDCNCRVCNNDDAPDMHEVCACYDCHDGGFHEDAAQWSADCEWCDEGLVYDAMQEAEQAKEAEAAEAVVAEAEQVWNGEEYEYGTDVRKEGEAAVEGNQEIV